MAEGKESLWGLAQFSSCLNHGIGLHLGSVVGLFLEEALHNQCKWKRGDVTGGPKSGQLLKGFNVMSSWYFILYHKATRWGRKASKRDFTETEVVVSRLGRAANHCFSCLSGHSVSSGKLNHACKIGLTRSALSTPLDKSVSNNWSFLH